MVQPIILVLLAYLLGAVPMAYLIGKRFHGIDITQVGNHNIGTVNAWRELGRRSGIVILILDGAKGAVVMAMILIFGLSELIAFAMAIAVTIGHNFSVFLNFKGGKGAAVVLGLSLVILPVLTLITVLVIPIVYYFIRSIIWSFFAALVVLNVLTIVTGQPAAQVGLCITLSLVVVATHLWRERRNVISALQKFDFVRLGQIE